MTATKLKDIYYKSTHGSSIADVANSTGVAYGVALHAVKRLKQYIGYILDGTITEKQNLRKAYKIAANWAVEQDNIKCFNRSEPLDVKELVAKPEAIIRVPGDVEMVVNTPSRYDKLNLAFSLFSDSVQSYIEQEVEAQIGAVKRENEDLKRSMDNARVGNWVDGLQTKFNPERKGL
jgi:hypothetical protein